MFCTVVSFVPFRISEEKPGVFPGRFVIPPSDGVNPQIIHVGNSKKFLYVNDATGKLSLPITADEIADSLVNDFCKSQLEYNPDFGPALFWVPGKLTVEEVKEKCKTEIKTAIDRQNKWFLSLVKVADDDWERYHMHKSISDTQRFAAKSLGMERDWLIEVRENSSTVKCIACKSVIEADALVCPVCRTVQDKIKAAKAGILILQEK